MYGKLKSKYVGVVEVVYIKEYAIVIARGL